MHEGENRTETRKCVKMIQCVEMSDMAVCYLLLFKIKYCAKSVDKEKIRGEKG